MADVRRRVGRRPADVHADLAGDDRLERHLLPAHRVVQAERTSLLGCSILSASQRLRSARLSGRARSSCASSHCRSPSRRRRAGRSTTPARVAGSSRGTRRGQSGEICEPTVRGELGARSSQRLAGSTIRRCPLPSRACRRRLATERRASRACQRGSRRRRHASERRAGVERTIGVSVRRRAVARHPATAERLTVPSGTSTPRGRCGASTCERRCGAPPATCRRATRVPSPKPPRPSADRGQRRDPACSRAVRQSSAAARDRRRARRSPPAVPSNVAAVSTSRAAVDGAVEVRRALPGRRRSAARDARRRRRARAGHRARPRHA